MTSRSARRIASEKRRQELKEFEERRKSRMGQTEDMAKTLDALETKYGKPVLEMDLDELYTAIGVELTEVEGVQKREERR